MRLSNTLVVACATVLLASGHALSETVNIDQATVSKLAPSELGASIDALASENKRSLRRHDDDDDDDDDEEERYKPEKIEKLRKGYWDDFFTKWNGREHSPINIEDKLDKLKKVLDKSTRDAIVRNYQNKFVPPNY
ncbi:hypothetical protein PF005_g25623 [Phytophthora fragariae]|uniref:RxLR effector protein n=1 Tax=Phytophthora fragariae TaxID=53985 RepID=A0A6A3DMC0_9STRA|nr:hypothetical protein PF003_g23583 [Phytophthora fragariae]KAE8922055.1 hypothetical protein PF009_g27668 [Phytophthora fragariae]KAE8971991.1 hypothetical protein PF011_g25817 [Phytophthora fragariae]KAE9077113.1 hypothetical protein PF010_g23637 [Phytophthora fragariae]KAE9097265.1 hypothetical protein PF006_g23607 [Phytophthora fragariae]